MSATRGHERKGDQNSDVLAAGVVALGLDIGTAGRAKLGDYVALLAGPEVPATTSS